jgi:hypothetical protein
MNVLGEVKAAYGADRDIAGIVAAGEEICRSLAEGEIPGSASTPGTTFTLVPGILETPTPTPTP